MASGLAYYYTLQGRMEREEKNRYNLSENQDKGESVGHVVEYLMGIVVVTKYKIELNKEWSY